MYITTSKVRTSSGRQSALVWIVSILLPFVAEVTTANPKGGKVVGGQATISSQTNRLDINQSSHKAIIDWRNFNISQGEHTNFNQPSSSSLTLNRVRGNQFSQINGRLTANGQIFLINPNGVIFGPNAQVASAGLVATTADIRNNDFMSGNYHFDQPSSNPNASISNLGQISVNDQGTVILAAPAVSNEGTIQARLGNVNLASTNTFTLDFYGDGLLSFEIEGQITQRPDSISDGSALINNSGTIIADGGTVSLTAQAADAVIDRVINMDGIIQAKTLSKENGKIVLSGGDHGIVDVSGTLDVSGTDKNETGGIVHVLGEKVGLFDGTRIEADGYAGGGEVLVGGNFQGKGSEPNALKTYVANNSEINASALESGNGGRVIVWADDTTQFYGDIAARGGKQSGDGGFVEISGKKHLNFKGTVSSSADRGKSGTILFDPFNIIINNSTASTVFDSPADKFNHIDPNHTIAFNDDQFSDFTINPLDLTRLDGKVVLQAENNITVDAPLDFTRMTETGVDAIILQANKEININADITTHGGDIHFEADLNTQPNIETININSDVKLASNGGDITLIANRINIDDPTDPSIESGINSGTGDIFLAKRIGEQVFLSDETSEFQILTKDIIVDDSIFVDPSSPPNNVFIAANDFEQIKTTGTLFLGRAKTAGTDGLGTDAQDLTSPNITINSETNFNANIVEFTAEKDIILNQNISTQGGDLILNPAKTNPTGQVEIDLVKISTNGGSISNTGDTFLIGKNGETTLSTNGGDIELSGTTSGEKESIFVQNARSLTLNAGDTGSVKLGDIEQTEVLFFGFRIPVTVIDNLNITGGLISLPGNIKTIGDQTYLGDVILNGDYTTTGGAFTVTGLTRLQGATTVNTINPAQESSTGGNIQFGNISGNAENSLELNSNLDGQITFDIDNESLTLNNKQNDFTGTLNLNIIGSEDIHITDKNLLQLGTSSIDTNNLVIEAQDLNINGAISSSGGNLTLQPLTIDQNININTSLLLDPFNSSALSLPNTLDLSSSDISNILNGFSTITIGRPGLTGDVVINNTTFFDPLTILANGAGASITVNGVLSGADNASITLEGSGATTTLNGNIITEGNPIFINDALILGNPVIPGGPIVLDTTAGGNPGADITFANTVNGSTPLTLSAGTAVGDISFNNDVGTTTPLGNVNVLTANTIKTSTSFVANEVNINASTKTSLNNVSTTGLQQYSSNLIELNGTYNTTGGDFIVTGEVDALGNTTIITQDGEIRFTGGINNNTDDGNLLLTLNAGSSGIVNLLSPVGATSPLGQLLINASTINTHGVTTEENTIFGVFHNGNQQYNGVVTLNNTYNTNGGSFEVDGNTTLGSNTTITTAGGDIQFGNITGGEANSLILDASLSGQITFNGINEALLLNNPQNDFIGTLSLFATGANDINISDANLLQLDSSSIGANVLTLAAQDLNFVGPLSTTNQGSLILQTIDPTQTIGLGDGAGSFSLTQSEIDNIDNGFESITIGSTTSTGNVIIDNATFIDDLIIEQANGSGATITVNNVLTGADDASITFNGSGTTTFLNGNIITEGNAITINDAVVLGGNSILLDTTSGAATGAEITFAGPVSGPTPFTLTAGAGAINLTDAANNFTGPLTLNNTGNNDVSVINNNTLTLGSSSVGSGQLNLTGTAITQTGAITQQAAATATRFTASSGAIDLTQANDFTSTINLTTVGANDINIVDINTLNLGASSIGTGDFTVTAGDLNIVGSIANSGGSITLLPFALNQNVGIGNGAGSFSLTQSEIDNIANGFASVTIGSSTSTGNVVIDNATFIDPLNIVQAIGSGATITVNNVLTGADDASITFNGSGTTTILNGNIITHGHPIVINDAVILGTPISPGSSIVLDTTDGGSFPGAGITFSSTVNGSTNLDLSAGANTGDILFSGAVGLTTPLGNVTVFNANDIDMNAQFLAEDTNLTYSGFWQNNSNFPFDLNSLFITPLAQGARVFGSINGADGILAAPLITSPIGDTRFTINGCVMGVFCDIPGLPDTNIADAPSTVDPFSLEKLELMNVWEQQKRLQDPRDERYSNLGNEELWRERTRNISQQHTF